MAHWRLIKVQIKEIALHLMVKAVTSQLCQAFSVTSQLCQAFSVTSQLCQAFSVT